MSIEQGIMGVLSRKPLSGYDIKKLFDISTAYFWPANQSQIDRILKQLSKDGLAERKDQKKGETGSPKGLRYYGERAQGVFDANTTKHRCGLHFPRFVSEAALFSRSLGLG